MEAQITPTPGVAGTDEHSSNRIPTLRDEVRTAHADVLRHTSLAIERGLAAGQMLAEAKSLCPHGAWGPFLAEAGIPERTAQRYLAIHRVGLTSATVADLGGIAAAANWASEVRLPSHGSALGLRRGGWDWPGILPLALVWPEGDGHHVGLLDLAPVAPHAVTTRRPLLIERAAWATLWHMLDYRVTELSFRMLEEGAAALIAEFEQVRAEA